MTRDQPPAADPCQALLEQARKVVASLRRATAEPTPGAQRTEFGDLQARREALAPALAVELEALAREAAAQLRAHQSELVARLAALEAERGDVARRREELAAAARGGPWPLAHKEKRDFLGPFTLEHRREASRIELGGLRLRELPYPSGAEVFQAVQAEGERLEAAARALWPDLKATLLARQQGDTETTVPWPDLLAALGPPDERPTKARRAAVVFGLVLLRARALEPGWGFTSRPPTLSHNNAHDAVTVPRLDRPGDSERIHALRLAPPPADRGASA